MSADRAPGIRPRESLNRRLDMAARRALPTTSTALLLLLLSAPLGLPGQAELQTATGLGCVFFWSVFRPDSMPPIAVFAIGLLTDLLSFAPIGIGMLCLLASHGVAMRARRVLLRSSYGRVWLGFAGLAGVTAAGQWAISVLLGWRLLPVYPAILVAGLAAGLYPALALLLGRVHQTLAEPERA